MSTGDPVCDIHGMVRCGCHEKQYKGFYGEESNMKDRYVDIFEMAGNNEEFIRLRERIDQLEKIVRHYEQTYVLDRPSSEPTQPVEDIKPLFDPSIETGGDWGETKDEQLQFDFGSGEQAPHDLRVSASFKDENGIGVSVGYELKSKTTSNYTETTYNRGKAAGESYDQNTQHTIDIPNIPIFVSGILITLDGQRLDIQLR